MVATVSRQTRSAFVVAVFAALSFACDAPPEDDDDDDDDDDRVEDLEPCETDEDCADDELCADDDKCHKTCSDEDPCFGDRGECDVESGICVQCLDDDDCTGDEVCGSDGECVDPADQSCVPNEVGCIDDSTAFVCNGDGTELVEAPCREDQVCIDAVCRTRVCEANSVVCQGNSQLVCDATGTSTAVLSCDDSCDASLGCSCVEGECLARTCEPGSARCVGNASQSCDAFGLEFGELEDCGDDDCIAGACLPDSCTPGAAVCSGRIRLECNAAGNGFDQEECEEACADGACTEQVCEPLSQQCVDGDTLLVCNGNGTGTVEQPCGPDAFCAADVCQNNICEPGVRECVGDAVSQCNAAGSDATLTPCAADQFCENGQCVDEACVPACGNRECGPDPVCGLSCGDCDGECNGAGQCILPTGDVMTVELSWTPTAEDMDLYLARDGVEELCSTTACNFATCQADDPRPDWNNSGAIDDGDPLLDVANISTTNPEIIRLTLPAGAEVYRVGADNFGPSSSGGTAVSAAATIRVRLNGGLVSTHSRTVPVDTQWHGVVISWSGSALSSNDGGQTTAQFGCDTPAGPSCVTDADCPNGQGCVDGGFPSINGTCQVVQCTSEAQCPGTPQCNGDHACTSALPLVGWKGACANDAECQVGFHCDFLTQACEEACNPTTTCGADCCVKSGGNVCTPDPFFQVTGNCDP